MVKALYAGSFDPFTNGHLNIVERSLKMFSELDIVIANNSKKKSFLPSEIKEKILNDLFKTYQSKVRVNVFSGLLVEYCKCNSISVIVKGVRNSQDFEMESQMAQMNKKLYPQIDTCLLISESHNSCISSTLVREIYNLGGDIKELVPKCVLQHINSYKLKK